MDKRPWYRILIDDIGIKDVLLFLILLAIFLFITFVLPILESSM